MKKLSKQTKRVLRNRKRLKALASRPRLSVHRTNKYIYAQIIDDKSGKTLASASSINMKEGGVKAAEKVGEILGNAAVKANVKQVVFDRAGYKYHGRIKALADAARKSGLEF